MNSISYIAEIPTVFEYNSIRKSVGWGEYDPKAVENGLSNTLYCLCVRKNSELIGFARVIGDGSITFYIQDVIVKNDFQGFGIGSQIMHRIMSYISGVAAENAIVGLFSAKGKETFYEKFGFFPRPNEKFGKGMFMFFNSKTMLYILPDSP